jgi:hypothetical protein
MSKKIVVCNSVIVLLLFALCGLGCNSQSKLLGLVPVEGIVYYDGKPLDGAAVNFIPQDLNQRSAIGTTDSTGKFTLMTLNPNDGATPGEYKITISKVYREKKESETDEQSSDSKDNIQSLIPIKYSIPNDSGLTATVPSKGVKDLKFELEK